MLTIDAGFKL